MLDISIKVTGLEELGIRLSEWSVRSREQMMRAMEEAVHMVEDQARANIMSQFHNSGKMASAVYGRVYEVGPDEVVGIVGAEGLPYLAIHEYGGTVHVPAWQGVFPQVRVFEYAGETVFTRRTMAHEVHIPERSYLRKAVEQREADVVAKFEALAGRFFEKDR